MNVDSFSRSFADERHISRQAVNHDLLINRVVCRVVPGDATALIVS